MSSTGVTLQDVLHALPPGFWAGKSVNRDKKKVLRAIGKCGNGAFGYTLVQCGDCGHRELVPRGCHNRNCPMCLPSAAAEWVEKQESKLLNTPYFHVIMTLPVQLRALALVNPKPLYNLLFHASRDTLLEFFDRRKPLGCTPSVLQVMHTWNQRLDFHPHIHMVVSGGGFNRERERWVPCPNPKFLFPGSALRAVFRDRFLSGLQQLRAQGKLDFGPDRVCALASDEAWQELVDELRQSNWNVHVKPPFGGAKQVVRYLSRYTHRTAISNRRLVSLERGLVTFSYTNRKAKRKELRTMPVEAFVTLFAIHIPPKGFHRVRSSGLIAPNAGKLLEAARRAAEAHPYSEPAGKPMKKEAPTAHECSGCGGSALSVVLSILPSGMCVVASAQADSDRSRHPPPREGSPASQRVAA